jgi:hypothetical protein
MDQRNITERNKPCIYVQLVFFFFFPINFDKGAKTIKECSWARGVAQVIECLPSKQAEFKPQYCLAGIYIYVYIYIYTYIYICIYI